MTDAPLVSALVPVFNGERFLGACLESILAQDDAALEVVVVDDGSTDGSGAVASSFDGVRLVQGAHAGLASARNTALAAARGSLIAWCDSDDVWKPGKLAHQRAYLDAHPECDVVLARMEHTFEEGAEWPHWLRRDQRFGDLDGVAMTSGLYRRPVFDAVGGFREQVGTDFDLVLRTRTAGCRIDVLDEVLHIRRVHDRNMMSHSEEGTTGVGILMPAVREHMRKQRGR